jgi:hypothetical protein
MCPPKWQCLVTNSPTTCVAWNLLSFRNSTTLLARAQLVSFFVCFCLGVDCQNWSKISNIICFQWNLIFVCIITLSFHQVFFCFDCHNMCLSILYFCYYRLCVCVCVCVFVCVGGGYSTCCADDLESWAVVSLYYSLYGVLYACGGQLVLLSSDSMLI